MARRRHARALALAALLLLAGVSAAAHPAAAAAHAALESSDPAADASVPTSPEHIVLTFSEDPAVDLSLVRLLDASGAAVSGIGAPEAVPGEPFALQVTPSDPLVDGVYTVNWRVVSAVDGHVESGAFAFGVGETPEPGSAVVVELLHSSPWASAIAVIGRWMLYVTLVLLIGAASTSLFVYGGRLPSGGTAVLRIAVTVAGVSFALMVWSERVLVGAPSLLPLFLTRQGQLLLALAVALLLCVGAVVAVDLWPARWSLWSLGATGAVAVLVHVAAGHAASPSSVWLLNIAAQWVHMTAVGVWVGGLFWLLLGLRGRDEAARATAVGRFTRVATVTLVVVLATGLARALSEAGSVDALLDSEYGVTLLVKIGLVAGLVALGALNHFFWVPEVRRGDGQGPRRFALNSRGELAVALGVLAATAILTALPPGVTSAVPGAASVPSGVTASGEDYATTVRVSLTVTPGRAGRNDYLARVEDYDGNAPAVGVTAVKLECSVPSDSGVNPVIVSLERAADGAWRGRGLEFSIAGLWRVSVLVEMKSGGVTVELAIPIQQPLP